MTVPSIARWAGAFGLLLLIPLIATEAARAEHRAADYPPDAPFVCAQVVLAIDGSGSTGTGAFRRQIEAFRAAFRQERLGQAIEDCLPGSAAFAVVTWSGADQQALCLGWTVVTKISEAARVAEHFKRCRYFGGTTDIGRAIDYVTRLLKRTPFVSYYRVVFVLTNGRTDRGREAVLAEARARAAQAGVTLDAYALLKAEPKTASPFYVPDAIRLEQYAAEHITTGPRAFTAHSRPEHDHKTLLRALIEVLRQEVI